MKLRTFSLMPICTLNTRYVDQERYMMLIEFRAGLSRHENTYDQCPSMYDEPAFEDLKSRDGTATQYSNIREYTGLCVHYLYLMRSDSEHI